MIADRKSGEPRKLDLTGKITSLEEEVLGQALAEAALKLDIVIEMVPASRGRNPLSRTKRYLDFTLHMRLPLQKTLITFGGASTLVLTLIGLFGH